MRARARLLALVVLLGLGTAPTPATAAPAPDPGRDRAAPAEPPTRTLAVLRLPRGRDTDVAFMQDGVIHEPGGASLPIRTPVNGEQRQLLGESRKGWLVAVRKGYLGRVIAVRAGRHPVEIRRTRFTTYGQGDSSVGWLLSRDGEMLISTLFDRGGSTRDVLALDGTRLGGNYSTSYFNPLDADAGHIVTYGEDDHYRLRVMDWVPRTSRTEIARAASYASLRDDLVFARTTGRLFGPTAISTPTTPVWAQPFSPLAVSPNGETAIGLRLTGSGFDSTAVLDVRRMSDGALLDSIDFGKRITEETWSITSQHEQTAAWETNHRFVFEMRTPRGSVLVRCSLDQRCQRASGLGGNVSFAHETYMWW
jgi:hypothetical protein